MKEKPVENGVVGGFKLASDGWHRIEFQENIGHMKSKGGQDDWQDAEGNKAYNFPIKVKDPDDPDDGANVGYTAFTKGGGAGVATMLDAAGLWEAIDKAFPGDNAPSIFDDKIMNGVKTKLPGRSCWAKTEVDKNGFAKAVVFADETLHKKLVAEETAKGGGKSAGKKAETKAAAPAEEAPW